MDPKLDRRDAHEGYSDITRKVKVDVCTFDGKIDTTAFSDSMVVMDNYFDWYAMSTIKQVRFAKMKLIGLVTMFGKLPRVTLSECVNLPSVNGKS